MFDAWIKYTIKSLNMNDAANHVYQNRVCKMIN
jgi:hypothetical protein